MKKKLTIKLVESNDTPKIGDIAYAEPFGIGIIIEKHDTACFYSPHKSGGSVTTPWERNLADKIKVIKPIAISDEEIKVGDKGLDLDSNQVFTCIEITKSSIYGYFNDGSSEDDGYNEYKEQSKKIELLPEHFSQDILQLIVDGILKDGSEIEVEFGSDQWSKEYGDFPYTDSNGHAIITIPESISFTERENVVHAFASAYDSAKKGIPHGIALEEYMKNNDKWIDKIMYSEEEVRKLCMSIYELGRIEKNDSKINGRYIDTSEEWFEDNKKK